MAIHTDATAVKAIIEVDPNIDLAPFIETSANLVTRLCLDSGYSDEDVELIERWLSAHFYAIRDPRTKQEGVKGLLEIFEGRTDLGLNHTRYGQMAMIIDTAGNLKAVDNANGKPIKIGVTWVGGGCA